VSIIEAEDMKEIKRKARKRWCPSCREWHIMKGLYNRCKKTGFMTISAELAHRRGISK